MIEKSTTWNVLTMFIKQPTRQFHLRELSRLTKLSMPTILTTTDTLAKEKLIIKTKGTVLTTVTANRDNPHFTRLKRVTNLEHTYTSGLVDHLNQLYNHPQAIILFGSYSRGEDTETSDIDIAIITNKKIHPTLETYEQQLQRKINIHETNLTNVRQEFKNNLANGIILEGAL